MTKGSAAKKVNAKKVAKAVEDKTFGMKNKGGKKNQAVVKSLTATIAGNQRKQASAGQPLGPSKKAVKAERDAELAALGLKDGAPKKTAAAPTANLPEIIEHEEMTEGRMLEDKIEEMRRNLPPNLTKITPESFAVWYAKKKKEKAEKSAKKTSKREKDIALGKVAMTGRELFDRKRNVFIDDDRADDDTYENDDTSAIFIASLEEQMRLDAESTETEFDEEKFKIERDKILERIKAERAAKGSSTAPSSSSAPSSSTEAASSSAAPEIDVNSLAAAPPIDESLFNEDDIPDDLPEDEE